MLALPCWGTIDYCALLACRCHIVCALPEAQHCLVEKCLVLEFCKCPFDSVPLVKDKLCPCHCRDRMALCSHRDTTAVQQTDPLDQ